MRNAGYCPLNPHPLYDDSVLIKRHGARRPLIGVAVALLIALTACLVLGFRVPPAANADELPQSITVDGVDYQRVHLVTLKTTYQDSAAVQVPITSRPILVRTSCRLAVLRSGRALSALGLEMVWMRTGGDVPDTQGNDYLACGGDGRSRLVQTLDPAWLPQKGNQLRLAWSEMSTVADTPSDSPASWALAVYLARQP